MNDFHSVEIKINGVSFERRVVGVSVDGLSGPVPTARIEFVGDDSIGVPLEKFKKINNSIL